MLSRVAVSSKSPTVSSTERNTTHNSRRSECVCVFSDQCEKVRRVENMESRGGKTKRMALINHAREQKKFHYNIFVNIYTALTQL